MRAAFLLGLAIPLLACGPAAAAPNVPRATGYEIGAWQWNAVVHPQSPEDGALHAWIFSVGRWQRVTRAVTWRTRLEYADLFNFGSPGAHIPEEHSWSDMGRSVMLRTGLDLHPPVTAGLAPYLGASVGAGYARPGDDHEVNSMWGDWQVKTRRRHAGAGVSIGVELGLRLFSMPGWPTACATLGANAVCATGGWGGTTEPVVWIGY